MYGLYGTEFSELLYMPFPSFEVCVDDYLPLETYSFLWKANQHTHFLFLLCEILLWNRTGCETSSKKSQVITINDIPFACLFSSEHIPETWAGKHHSANHVPHWTDRPQMTQWRLEELMKEEEPTFYFNKK